MEPDDSTFSRNFSKKASSPRAMTSCCAIRFPPPATYRATLMFILHTGGFFKVYLVFYVVNMCFYDLLICNLFHF